MKKSKLILLITFLFIEMVMYAQTKLPECNTGVPHFNIDLSLTPDSMYITPNVTRSEQCCGSPNSNDNYVSFYVKAHPDVAMIEVDIYSGANPPGDAAKYNVITGGDAINPGICGPDINAGSPTCVTLDPSGYLKVTYYKPGSNKNEYYFKQIPKPIFPNDDTTRVGCSLPLAIYGLDNIVITSINSSTGNTTLGAYNSLLSCTNCAEPMFSPGLSTPAWIDYQICGSPQAAACGTYASCDTVRLYTFGELALSVNPNPASFCSGGGGVTLTATATGGDGNYTYKWKDSFGTVVSTSNTYNATTAGSYTAEVADGLTTTLCPVEYISVPVTIGNPPVVSAGIDQTLCATSPSVLLSGSIQYATGGIWTGGNGTFSPAADSLLTVYTPTAAEISAGSITLTLTSTGAGGGCANDSDKVTISFSDTIFVNPTAIPIVCSGDVTTISANATGGTAPLTYVWSNGATSPSISASAGTYSVMVRDAVGCVSFSQITVVDPAPMTLTLSSTNVSADPLCDGSASVVITGGSAPYSVLWSNSEITLTTSNTLCYGVTTVSVTDANGCIVTGSVVVNNPTCSGFNVTATSTDVDCYGGTNGTATAFPVGGAAPYSYVWNSTPNQTTQAASNLPAGNYTVTVTDDLGCVDVAGVTISQPTIITNTITHTDVTTIGGSDGSATANPQGGTPNYSYLWSPGGQTTQTASNLSSAVGGLTYYLTITDDNSCTYNDSVLINQPPCTNFILSVNTDDISCNGLSDGSAYVVVAHGTPPYNIVWSHGPTNVTSVSGLSQGTYTVTVTDASNCTTFQNFTITEPAPLSLSLVPTNVVCNGDNNGTIDLTVAGGTFPYKYTWKLGTTTIANHEDLVNLAPGTYSVTVTDDNKCTATGSVGITQPSKLDASAVVVDNICFGATNASIDMTPIGGMLPYNYTWTGPSGFTSSSEDISNLNVGLYEFSFTDGNGCQSPTYQSYINEPDTVLIGNIEVPCPTPGASTVIVNVDSIIGGNGGPYQVSFDNQATYQPTGVYTYSLNVGATYQVWARDTNGCTSLSPYVLTIETNVAVTSVNFNSCIPFGATTIPVTVNPTGGNGGSYQVSTDGGTTWTTVGTYVVNLAVDATHNVIVRDANNCVSTNYTFYIPAEISSSITMTSEVSCLGLNDGALDLTVNGGVPNYNFAWTGPSGFNSTNEDLSGLFAGMYYVTITDDEGCIKLDSIEITTVIDTINPIITCVGNQTVNTSLTTCDYTVSGIAWDAVATDNCVVSNLSYSLSGATTGTGSTLNNVAFNLGTTTVTWTATDSLGNMAQCTYTIIVIDNIDPSIVACGAGNQTVNVDAGQCSFTQTANVWDATATDNCTVSTITADLSGATTATGLTTLNGVSFNTGVTTVLWTVTDTVGNSVTCTYTITVIDNIDPSIVACGAGNQTVNVDAGQCSFTQTANVWDATATDNCTVDSIYYTLSGATSGTGTTLNGVSFNTGVTTVLWTVTDTVGNSVTCTYTITVIDNIDPSIIACGAGNQTVNVDAGQCSFTQTANVWDATATDNCTVSTITADLSGATTATGLTTLNGVSFNTGVTTVLWTVTDTVGNSVTCTYTITVIDNIDPSIVACGAGNQVMAADSGVCTYTHTDNTWDATATDNCTIDSIYYTLSGATSGTGTTLNGVTFNNGITTVLWTVTDTVGNTVTCSFSVDVLDTEAPIISNCPTNITVSNDSSVCGAVVTWTPPTFTDNCGAIMTSTHNPGDSFIVGTTVVTYTVTDSAGNVSTCTFNVIVNDTELPIITCSPQIASCDSLVNFNAPTATDNCGILSITQIAGLPSGSTFPVGTTTNTFEVIDIHNNVAQCSFDVVIHPTPIISSVSTDVSCFGLNDGSIDITVTNGTTPYTYAWSNSANTEDIANLAPGIYSVTVTDSNLCMATAQDTILEPALLTIVATDTNVTCFGGSNGAIDITVAGGIAPYTYLWNTNDTIADLSNLSVGYYEVTVTDSNGCTVSYSTTITSPDSIAIQTTANNATCLGANGSIQTQVIGGVMPYSYAWSNGDTTLNLNNVTAGVYTLVLTDGNGCTAQITDTVNSVSNLVVELATEDVSCFGKADGEIRVITTSGNPPYAYNWSTGDSTSVVSGLDVGGYYVIVTDSFGCQDSLYATIYQPDSLVVELDAYEYPSGTNISLYGGEDGSIVSMVFGGTSPYEYLWSTGDTTADINDLKAGEYSLIVTDENGCNGFAKIILIQPNVLEMPNGYSPNGDGSNDFFVIKGVEAYPDNEIVVFNRWGNIVYEGKNYNNEWNGGNKSGEDLPDGTYFVIFKVLSPEEITLQGYVDLRRK